MAAEEKKKVEDVSLVMFDEDEEYPISFTKGALSAVKDAIQFEQIDENLFLRVGLRGGGCAGFQYVLDFTSAKENDYLMKFGDIDVLIDPISAMHLEGTTIDYVTSLMGSGFKFINPNAKKTCGCGSSFG
jgi:iron-sulfur cluster assembly accessory protein